MEYNIINANFNGEEDRVVYTKKMYQHDRAVVVRISGLALPEKYQVQFANDPHGGVSASKTVSGSDFRVPNVFLRTGKNIYIWIYMVGLEENSKVGYTDRQIIIPVEPRPDILPVYEVAGGDIIATLDEDEHALVFSYRP